MIGEHSAAPGWAVRTRLLKCLAAAVAAMPSPLDAGPTQTQPLPEEPAALVAQARELIKSEDYVWALALVRRALRVDSRLAKRTVGRMERRLDELITGLELDSNPARREALRRGSGLAGESAGRAIEAFVEGRDMEAYLHAAVAVGEDPKTEVFRSLLRLIGSATGIRVSALDLLPRAELIEQKLQRSEREFFAGNYSNAARESQDVVWLDSRNALAWARLGSSWWAAGERAKAAQAFERALALDPEDAHLQRFLRAKGLLGQR